MSVTFGLVPKDLSSLIANLRTAGGDDQSIEVKSAAGGLPESLTSTLSALANLPGGGMVILGLDERAGFRPVQLADTQTLKQGLASKARSYKPPVKLTVADAVVDGAPVIVATVHECDRSSKPCRVTSTGEAYLRSHDGDFRLSELEEQGFLSERQAPHLDRKPVEEATLADLDSDLVDAWLTTVRERDPDGLGRFPTDEVLRRAGVVTSDKQLTVAGLLTLGKHPQQWFPRYVIQVAAAPRLDDPPEVRARNSETISGPIPLMLDSALEWARNTFDSFLVTRPDGSAANQSQFPFRAFRELISNALVHRDLDHWSEGLAIEVRLQSDHLVVTSPGGLYGITVDRLGHESVTSARNARLVSICQYAISPRSRARVTEALSEGLRIVAGELQQAGLPEAHYIDSGIRFTAVLRRPEVSHRAITQLEGTSARVYDALTEKPKNVPELEKELGLTGPNIRKVLRSLRQEGLVEQHGGKGRPTTYSHVRSR